ncbi:MAG: ATP synthase F0 subunit B [Candidatus Aminicenantes bacterium]|nr:ATP synthase F0 subunit B [Candidatus Aminicenantes bacterium]
MKAWFKSQSVLYLLLLFLLLTSGLLQAGEEPEHGSAGLFLGQVINFAVLFGGLAYLLRKPLQEYLNRKALEVASLLETSEKEKQEARQRLEQTRERVQSLAAEVQRIKDEARKEALREKERLLQEAAREAERLRKLAREEVESMVQASRRELKAYAIELSVNLAEKRIKEKISPELHRKFISQAIDHLRGLHESSVAD